MKGLYYFWLALFISIPTQCKLLTFNICTLFPHVYTCLVNFYLYFDIFLTFLFQFFVDCLFYTEYTILLYLRHSILTFYSVKSLSIGTQPQVGSFLVSGERVVWNISKVLTSLEFTFMWKEADHILDIIKLYEDSKAINEIKGIWDNLNKRAGKVSLSNWFFLNEYPVTPRFKRAVL